MIVTIIFNNNEVKRRFVEWVAEGNSRSMNSYGGTGIRGHYKEISKDKFLFFWETNSPFGDYVFLRFALWFNFRKKRGQTEIRRPSREDLARLVLEDPYNGTN